jgi:hypothetical protein
MECVLEGKKEVNRHNIHFKKSEIFYKTEEPEKDLLYMLVVEVSPEFAVIGL